MKLSGSVFLRLTVRISGFSGKAVSAKNLSKKQIVLALGTAITLSGFFYSFFQMVPVAGISDSEFISPALAKEIEEQKLTDQDFAEFICNQSLDELSISNPNLAVYKIEKLCGDFETIDSLSDEPSEQELQQEKLRQVIADILEDTSMESMIEPISQQEKIVAAFLVGIALKESGLGRHAPVKYGRDCFNYWGYKGGINPTAGGYSCFSSPQHAVEVVGKRIHEFSINQSRNTPSKMLVWKCGSSCFGHTKNGVQKWVSDVSIYFNKINRS